MKIPPHTVLLRCRTCGHEWLEAKLAVDLMK
jgi:hypothetical protein